MSEIARIPPGSRRELGLINWVISKVAARTLRIPHMHLFETLGQHKVFFWAFLVYGEELLNRGKLSKQDKELVILRIGHLRNSTYELQHHRRLARSRGLDDVSQAMIFAGPDADGLSDRQRAMVRAVDEFTANRNLSDDTYAALASHLNQKQVIEFCALAGHYDTIAGILATLRIPMDYPN